MPPPKNVDIAVFVKKQMKNDGGKDTARRKKERRTILQATRKEETLEMTQSTTCQRDHFYLLKDIKSAFCFLFLERIPFPNKQTTDGSGGGGEGRGQRGGQGRGGKKKKQKIPKEERTMQSKTQITLTQKKNR